MGQKKREMITRKISLTVRCFVTLQYFSFCHLNIRHKDIFSSQKFLGNYEGQAFNAKVGLQNPQVENGMNYGVSVEVPGNSTKDYKDHTTLFNHCKGQQ